MAIYLDPASDARVEFGDLAAVAGATALCVAYTIKYRAAPADARVAGQWGTDPNNAWLITGTDTDEVGFVVSDSTGKFFGIKTTASNFTNGSTYRVVGRISGLGVSATGDIWVNGSAATTTSWFSDAPASVRDAGSTTFVGREDAETADGENADFSEFAIWTENIPDWMAAAYGLGYSPDHYLSGLALYAPLMNALDLLDVKGAVTGTNTAGVDAPHPSMYQTNSVGLGLSAAGGATNPPDLTYANFSIGCEAAGGPITPANAGDPATSASVDAGGDPAPTGFAIQNDGSFIITAASMVASDIGVHNLLINNSNAAGSGPQASLQITITANPYVGHYAGNNGTNAFAVPMNTVPVAVNGAITHDSGPNAAVAGFAISTPTAPMTSVAINAGTGQVTFDPDRSELSTQNLTVTVTTTGGQVSTITLNVKFRFAIVTITDDTDPNESTWTEYIEFGSGGGASGSSVEFSALRSAAMKAAALLNSALGGQG